MIRRSRLFLALSVVAALAAGIAAEGAAAAQPAWSPIAATGPTVLPPLQSEVQKVYVDAEEGTFTLTARHLAATGLLESVFGEENSLTTLSGSFAVGQTAEGPKIVTGTVITAVTSNSLTFSPGPGELDIEIPVASYDTPETTGPIPYNAPASVVQSALEALPDVGSGNVEVTGGPGGVNAENPYVVAYKGALANTNVGQLIPNGAFLGSGSATVQTIVNGGQGTTKLALMVQNVGGTESTGAVTYRATLPAGFTALSTPKTSLHRGLANGKWSCPGSTATEIVCTWAEKIRPGFTPASILVTITAAPGVESGTVHMEASGAGGPLATGELPIEVSATPAEPGVQSFVAGAFDENGSFDTRAGGHPYSASTALFVNTVRSPKGTVIPAGEFREIRAALPPGFLGNPEATPQCPDSVLPSTCPLESMVGIVSPVLKNFGAEGTRAGVFNTEAPFGYPGKFRFLVAESVSLNAVANLRSDEDYGLDATSFNTPTVSQVYGVFFTFWGQPADSSHDTSRCRFGLFGNQGECKASSAPHTAFLTSATNCAEQAASHPIVNLFTTVWQLPGTTFHNSTEIPPVTGCENLVFDGDLTFESSDTKADSPASFSTSLAVPSEGLTDPTKLTTPEIKDTVVQLPQGVVLNASGADGLESCSEQQIGYKGNGFPMPNPMRFNKEPNTCPEASKIGTAELTTPLLDEPLHGALYLAAQGDGNPFGSLFAIYLVIEDPRHGIFIKLPGKVEPDPQTGQMTVTFENLPQLPFTSLDLNLKGGDRSALATPQTCGTYTTKTTFTPWSAPESGPPTVSESQMTIDSGANGAPCATSEAQLPFNLGFEAGTDQPAAGGSSPFQLRLTRPDGAQTIDTLEVKPPPGLTASLRGIPYCGEPEIAAAEAASGKAEQANPSCPAASQVGTTLVGAGSGPRPFYVPGKVYLAGPYKGAPLSLVAVTPAVAGPLDLGTVVVRSALFVDTGTAQITAVTDPLPQILKGVPLRVRDVRIDMNRADFTINPTDCEPMQIDSRVTGDAGAVSNLSSRFQVGGCENLGFKPNLKLSFKGGTTRTRHPALKSVLTFPTSGSFSNIASAAVTLPHSEIIDPEHVGNPCTRPQFAEETCPKISILGRARAWSPLLDQPLEGKVYFRSNGGERKLPDVVADLRGQIDVILVGAVDTVTPKTNARIRTTFFQVPDAPVSKFELELKGGKEGLLVNSENLCKSNQHAVVNFTAHNGLLQKTQPKVANTCKKTQGKKNKRARPRARR